MKKEMVFVIKDELGNFVSGVRTFMFVEGEWFYLSYTGKSTGYTFFTNKEKLEESLAKLQDLNNKYGFGKRFTLEEIDLDSVQKGEIVIKDIVCSEVAKHE